jgi:hypothetical protein
MSLRQLAFFGLFSLVAVRGFGASDTVVIEKGTVFNASLLAAFRDGDGFVGRTVFLDASQAVFPNEEIPDSAFFRCGYIEGIKFPATIKRIGIKAFEQTGLRSIELPADLEVIEVGAFYACRNLAGELHLPTKLRRIGGSSFYYCTTDNIGSTNPYQETPLNGQLYGAFEGCMMLDTLILHTIVLDTIGAMSFGYCTNLKGQIALDRVKHIGTGAFTHTLLSRVEIGGLRYIGGYKPVLSHFEGAFEYCEKLQSPYVEDDDSVYTSTVIEPRAFAHIHPAAGGITLVLDKTESYYSDIADSDDRINLLTAHRLTLSTRNTLISSIQAINSPRPIGRLSLVGMVNADELAGLKAVAPQLRSLVMGSVLLSEFPQNVFTPGSAIRRIVFPNTLKSISASALNGVSLSGVLRLPPSLVSIEDAEDDKGFLENNTGIMHIILPPTQPNGKDSTGFTLRKIGDRSFVNMKGLLDWAYFKPNYWVSMAKNAFANSKVKVNYFEIDSAKLHNLPRITFSEDGDTTVLLQLEVYPYYFTGEVTFSLIDSITGKAPTYIKIDSAHCTFTRDSLTNTAVFSYPLTINNYRTSYSASYSFLYRTDGEPETLASGSFHFKYTKAETIRFDVVGEEVQGEDVTVKVNTPYTIRAIVTPANLTDPQINWYVTGPDWVTEPDPSYFHFDDKEGITITQEENSLIFSRKVYLTEYDALAYVNVTTPDGAAGARLTLRTDSRSIEGFRIGIRNVAEQTTDNAYLAQPGETLTLEVDADNLDRSELPPVTWAIRTHDNAKNFYGAPFTSWANSERTIVIPPSTPDTSFRVSVSITTTNTKGVQQTKTASFMFHVAVKVRTFELSVPGKSITGGNLTDLLQDEEFTVKATIQPANASITLPKWGTLTDVLDPLGNVDVVKDPSGSEITYSQRYKVLRTDKDAFVSVSTDVRDMQKEARRLEVLASTPIGFPYELWLEKVVGTGAEPFNDNILTLTQGQSVTLRAVMRQEQGQPQWSLNVSPMGSVTLELSGDGTMATVRAKPWNTPIIEGIYAYLTVSVRSGPNGQTLTRQQVFKVVHTPITNLFLSTSAADNAPPATGIGQADYDEQYLGVSLTARLEPAYNATYPSYRWSIHPEGYAQFTSGTDVNDRWESRYVKPLVPNREFTVSIRPVVDTSIVKGYSYTIRAGRAGHKDSIRFEEPDTVYMLRNQERDLTVLSQVPAVFADMDDLAPEDFYPLSWRLVKPAVAYFVGKPKAEIVTRDVANTPVKFIKYTHRIRAFLADSATMIIVRDSNQVGSKEDTIFLTTHSPLLPEVLPIETSPAPTPAPVAVQNIAILADGREVSDVCLEPEATVDLLAALSPQEATYTDVHWVVEDPTVAVIVQNRGLRAGLSEGASCSLKVLRHDASTRVFAFSLDAAAATTLPSDTLVVRSTPAPAPAPEDPAPAPEDPAPAPEDPAPAPEAPAPAPEDPAPAPEDPAPAPEAPAPAPEAPAPAPEAPAPAPEAPAPAPEAPAPAPEAPAPAPEDPDPEVVFTPKVPSPPLADLSPEKGKPAVFYQAQTLHFANLEGFSVLFSGISGRIFFFETGLPSSNEYRYLPLSPGIYILSASKDKHRETVKLVVE